MFLWCGCLKPIDQYNFLNQLGGCRERRNGTGLSAVASQPTFHFGLQQCLHPFRESGVAYEILTNLLSRHREPVSGVAIPEL